MASSSAVVVCLLVLFSLFPVTQSLAVKYTNGTDKKVGMTCDEEYCPSYCCYDDWSNWVCCDDYDVTDMWWFWFSFALGLFFLSLFLGFCCRHRNRVQRRRYLIITGERPVVTSYGTEYIAPVMAVPPGYSAAPNAPYMVVPSPYPNAQLPAYTPTAEEKGNPPKYNS